METLPQSLLELLQLFPNMNLNQRKALLLPCLVYLARRIKSPSIQRNLKNLENIDPRSLESLGKKLRSIEARRLRRPLFLLPHLLPALRNLGLNLMRMSRPLFWLTRYYKFRDMYLFIYIYHNLLILLFSDESLLSFPDYPRSMKFPKILEASWVGSQLRSEFKISNLAISVGATHT